MSVVTVPRLLAALAAASLFSALYVALPGFVAGDPDMIRPLMALGAVLPLLIVLPIAAVVVPACILFGGPRRSSAAEPFARSRALAAVTGGAVGALLGVCAASGGHIAASVVVVLTASGAILGYADACWREPPQRPAR